MRRLLAPFREGETPAGSIIPPAFGVMVFIWLGFLPFSAVITARSRNPLAIDLNILLAAAALINDWQAAWRWRHGWRTGRYDVVVEMFEAWHQSMDPREWLMRELYFGDPNNTQLHDLFGPDDPPVSEAP